jgi:hypothetical protein
MRAVVDSRATLAVWKFASCDGCQLSLLDCESELLALAGVMNIAHFTEMSRATAAGPYDISLVEGSITTPDRDRRLCDERRRSGAAQFRTRRELRERRLRPPRVPVDAGRVDTDRGARARGLRIARLSGRPLAVARGARRDARRTASGHRGALGVPGVQVPLDGLCARASVRALPGPRHESRLRCPVSIARPWLLRLLRSE